MPSFEHQGHRLAYTERGSGPRTVVLLHGLLLSQKMHVPLSRALAARGNRVVTLDLLGHGQSDRPADMTQYSMVEFGRQVVALLDHLDVEEAVLLGTSLGANTALEAAVAAPERCRGLVVEMPVLDNALLGCALAFTPLMAGLTFGEPLARLVGAVARAIPSRDLFFLDVGLDTVRQDPRASAAVLQGLFFGRVAPVHPFSDAGALHEELPDARLLEADSILELRLAPERLTDEIAAFVDERWRPVRRRRAA
jgi:pimeloyl-ACP methyl ester carboxylesterase